MIQNRLKQPVVLVLGRSLYKQLSKEFQKPLNDDRLLILSSVSQTTHRHSIQSCLVRNKFITAFANEIVFGSLDKNGNLYPLISFWGYGAPSNPPNPDNNPGFHEFILSTRGARDSKKHQYFWRMDHIRYRVAIRFYKDGIMNRK